MIASNAEFETSSSKFGEKIGISLIVFRNEVSTYFSLRNTPKKFWEDTVQVPQQLWCALH